jgi:putative transposase
VAWIDRDSKELSLRRQCELAGVSRSSLYYQPVEEDEATLAFMRFLDEQYTLTPFYGIRKMTEQAKLQGWRVNHKRVGRLLRKLGLAAIYPRPSTSAPASGHRIYPYLLRDVPIVRPDQVWSTDITYVRLRGGFVYLVAIMDWYSRYVLAWEVSTTLDADFCLSALEWALQRGTPQIFNTDQGSQFTSEAFTGRVLSAGAKISMDGRGRALDNVFVERLWRSVKYEEVYLKDYQTVSQAVAGLGGYFNFYNTRRLHQSLAYRTPGSVYLRQATT